MTAKLRIKAKGIEIEWEGEVEYLKNDLPDLIAAIVAALGINAGGDDDDDEAPSGADAPGGLGKGKTFTTSVLAARLKPNSGSDLFKVALAKLQLSDKMDTATRAQIHKEMQAASKFYKPSMKNNLNNAIDTLIGQGVLNEPSAGNYALTESAQAEIETKI
jgi:hypothetical protein